MHEQVPEDEDQGPGGQERAQTRNAQHHDVDGFPAKCNMARI